MPKQKPSLIRQFPEKHRKLVKRILERDGGDLTRSQYYHHDKRKRIKEIDKYSGLSWYDTLLRNLQENYGCTGDELEAMAAASFYSGGYSANLLRRGVARRIVHDDPGELEAALSLGARFEWMQSCLPSQNWDYRYPGIWTVFRALVTTDGSIGGIDRPSTGTCRCIRPCCTGGSMTWRSQLGGTVHQTQSNLTRHRWKHTWTVASKVPSPGLRSVSPCENIAGARS